MDEEFINKLSDVLSDNNIDINKILENVQNSSSPDNSDNNENQTHTLDTDTLLKIQKLAKLLNKTSNSNDEVLLKALKPYVRDTRKEKIDTYIKLLHIFKIFEQFQEMGGNLNDFL